VTTADPADLYGLPLERFTAERTALAKRLRQDGERDQASEVSKLRKPSVAAWAVNQLVRTQKRGVDELFQAGDELARAQASVLAHRGDTSSLRDAVDAERSAVDALVDRARGLLSDGGVELSAARLEQVRETLHAAALDEEARAQVRAGRLERELRYVGLGSLGGGTAAAARPARPARKDDGKKRAAEAAAVRQAAAQAERRRQAEARLRDAERALGLAREAQDRALRERDRAQRALDELT
jgi:hypothetical protein